MKAINQLRTFQRILDEYPAETPLSKFLPGFYRLNKQMGSTDRRVASRLVYNYFRLGRALPDLPADERLFIAEFLCNTQLNSFLQHFKPEWAACIDFSPAEKLAMVKAVHHDFNLEDVFPWTKQLSAGIDKEEFLRSFFVQPIFLYVFTKGLRHRQKLRLLRHKLFLRMKAMAAFACQTGPGWRR